VRESMTDLLTLDEVVKELLDVFSAQGDWPAEHRCTKTGPNPCTHAAFAATPLLVRLQSMVVPGTAPAKEDPGKRPRGQRHSPAPWDRKAGELVDEILRGSIDLNARMRRLLGFTPLRVRYVVTVPTWQPPLAEPLPVLRRASALATRAPVEDAGREALRDIVRILPLLRDRHPDHDLAMYAPYPGEHVQSWEQPPEPAVRSWHQQALLITGHEQPWPRVTQVPNPDHPDHLRRGEYFVGPIHSGCAHPSCRAMRKHRRNRWVQARCPYCGSASLRQNPITQSVECQRPSCKDERGRPNVWTIHELRALGLAIEERDSA